MLRLSIHGMIIIFLIQAVIFQVQCGKPTQDITNKIVLTIWETYNDAEHQLFMQLVKEYQTNNPEITIEVQRIPFDAHEPKILTALTSHTVPDIARVDTPLVAKLARRHAILSLDQYGAQQIKNQYIKAAINSNIIDEKIFGLPDQITGAVLFYNKTMFKSAGLDPDRPPKTWSEFLDYAKLLTDRTKKQYGFAMHNSLWWTLPFFNTWGAEFLNADKTKCVLNSDAGISAFQFKVDLYRKHKVEAGAWIAGGMDPDTGFQLGRYAMILSGQWNLELFEKAGIDFGVGLIPAGPAGTSTNVGGTNMVIFKESKYPKEAYDFLVFLTCKESQAKWATVLGQVPVNLEAYELVDTSRHPYLPIFMEQMKTAIARPQLPDYSAVEVNIFNPEMEAALNGDKTVKQALDDAVRKTNELLLGLK